MGVRCTGKAALIPNGNATAFAPRSENMSAQGVGGDASYALLYKLDNNLHVTARTQRAHGVPATSTRRWHRIKNTLTAQKKLL